MKNKRKFRSRMTAAVAAAALILAAVLSACAPIPVETSGKYMVGFIYSSGSDWDMSPGIECRVRYDKSVDAIFEWYDGDSEIVSKTLNFELSDRQFSNIEQVTDPQEIYYLRPQCNNAVQDGSDDWLFVYGPDDAVLKKCGGYCPENKRFNEISSTLYLNMPDRLIEVYSQYEEIYIGESPYEPEYREKQFNILFDSIYSQYVSE